MSTSNVDLTALARRMADRRTGRTEANVQSDLHMLLTAAPLQLDHGDLQEIVLESPAGQRRRIDVEAGFTVFEVKRDLRVGNVRADAVTQLAGYVSSRHAQTGPPPTFHGTRDIPGEYSRAAPRMYSGVSSAASSPGPKRWRVR